MTPHSHSRGRNQMTKYTDEQIENACVKCVDDWDMETLLRFAYDEMYHHYTEVAKADSLDAFMQEMTDELLAL